MVSNWDTRAAAEKRALAAFIVFDTHPEFGSSPTLPGSQIRGEGRQES
jgi:hypothetical protein